MGGFGFMDALNSMNNLGNILDACNETAVDRMVQNNLPNIIENKPKANKTSSRPQKVSNSASVTHKSVNPSQNRVLNTKNITNTAIVTNKAANQNTKNTKNSAIVINKTANQNTKNTKNSAIVTNKAANQNQTRQNRPQGATNTTTNTNMFGSTTTSQARPNRLTNPNPSRNQNPQRNQNTNNSKYNIKSSNQANKLVNDKNLQRIKKLLETPGLKKVLKDSDLITMPESYLHALEKRMSRNEENFVVLDCNGQIRSQLRCTKDDFMDNEFMNECNLAEEYQDIDWQPLSGLKYNKKIFANIKPENATQGTVLDCWFIAPMSSLASQQPGLVKRMINPRYNRKGYATIVEVWLCDSGRWKPFVLDTMFPSDGDGALNARPGPTDCGTWQMFIEKAYAKMYRNYSVIAWGHCGAASREMTGAPSTIISLKNPEEGFEKLINALNNGWIISNLSRKNKLNESTAWVTGNHCYGVLDAVEVPETNTIFHQNMTRKYILMKNPWDGCHNGHIKPLYSWQQTPEDQEIENKKIITREQQDELWKLSRVERDAYGELFWMNYDSYLDCFCNFVYLNKVMPDYCQSSLELYNEKQLPRKRYLIKATAPKDTFCTITLNKKQLRHQKLDPNRPKSYGLHKMFVFDSKDSAKFANSTEENTEFDVQMFAKNNSCESTNNCNLTFEKKSTAYIMIEANFGEKECPTTVLSAYSSKPVLFEQVNLGYEEGGVFEAVNPRPPTPIESDKEVIIEYEKSDRKVSSKPPTPPKPEFSTIITEKKQPITQDRH